MGEVLPAGGGFGFGRLENGRWRMRGEFGDEVFPSSAVLRGHFLPAGGVAQKGRAFGRRQQREFREGFDANAALCGRKFREGVECFLDVLALAFRKFFERARLLGTAQLEKRGELGGGAAT